MERSLEITASRLDSVANAPNSTNSTCSKSPLLLGTCVSLLGLVKTDGHVPMYHLVQQKNSCCIGGDRT